MRNGESQSQASVGAQRDVRDEVVTTRTVPEFHVFPFREKWFLLTVGNSAVFELSEEVYNRLSLLEAGLSSESGDDQRAALSDEHHDRAWAYIEELQQQGFLPVRGFGEQPPRISYERHAEALLHARPRSMWMLVAQTCNLRCGYCYGVENRYEDTGVLMNTDTARAAVDLLFKRSGRRRSLRITFFGGEPAMNMPVVRDTVAYSKTLAAECGKEMNYSFSTNGIALNDRDMAFCAAEGFSMQFSLDGDRAAHDRYRVSRGGKGTYNRAVKAIRRYIEVHADGDIPKIRATMTPGNDDPTAIAGHFDKLGFRYYGVGSSQACADGPMPWDLGATEYAILDEQFDEMACEILDTAAAHRALPTYNPFFAAMPSIHRVEVARISCGVGRNDLGVGADGKLYPCHRYAGMSNFVLGDAWNGIDADTARDYYRDLLEVRDRACGHCWARNLCSGQCPWSKASRSGAHKPPREYVCRTAMRSIERNLYFYFTLRNVRPDLLASLIGVEEETLSGPG